MSLQTLNKHSTVSAVVVVYSDIDDHTTSSVFRLLVDHTVNTPHVTSTKPIIDWAQFSVL